MVRKPHFRCAYSALPAAPVAAQPIGIASIYQRLCTLHQNEHEAQHDILDCLAETIWHAQRHQTTLDNNMYLQLLAKKAGLQPPGGHG